MNNPSLVYGDRSKFSLDLLNTSSIAELRELKGISNIGWERNQPPSPEIAHRQSALVAFFEAVDLGRPSSQTQQYVDIDKVVSKLRDSEMHFDLAWPNAVNSASKASPEWSELKSEAAARIDVIKADYKFDDAILAWLSSIEVPTRGTQVVLDLALNVIVPSLNNTKAENEKGIHGQVDKGKEVDNEIRGEIRSLDWLIARFRHRAKSLNCYRSWALPDGKSYVANGSYVPHNANYNFCENQDRSVCTAILFGSDESGSVLWLTVDLYEDGMGSFAPDVFSLGWTQIALNLSSERKTEEENEVRGILASFDEMWRISGLAELGFSGKWRITNRPLVTCEASLLEPSSRIPLCFDEVFTGRSAEAATIVGLLAASGLVYEPIPKEFPTQLEARRKIRDRYSRVALNPCFAATATVEKANVEDVRLSIIWKVYLINCKCSAASRYKPEYSESVAPFIDTIVLSQADLEEQTNDQNSFISGAISDKKQKDRQSKGSKYTPFRGVHFQPCKSVQDALNWMLSVNQWKRIWNDAKLKAWEKQWDVVRNEFGKPIGREVDENGNHVVLDDEEHGISTGSIEYMRNPFGGAKRPETVSNDNEEAFDDNDGVIPAE